eukprot:CAMPEP_0198655816 /NCGR_PEP_ID=MMETSP1467-20131203/8602_1 /TAXON_ID=1462469 /ORGANISM="unid. sp., Strain CCMP2135" /LENGTH=37 /DNA_ID= /DNA_START= /DNA_END= /DNA_ORIENTATION=
MAQAQSTFNRTMNGWKAELKASITQPHHNQPARTPRI